MLPLLLVLRVFSPPPPQGLVVPLPPELPARTVVWSPDGQGVATCGRGVALVGRDGTVIPVLADTSCRAVAFEDDALWIATTLSEGGHTLLRFDGLALYPVQLGAPVRALAARGDLFVATETELVRLRDGEVSARKPLISGRCAHQAPPGSGECAFAAQFILPTPEGIAVVGHNEGVLLDLDLVEGARWSGTPTEAVVDAVAVGGTVVVAQLGGWVRAIDRSGRVVAEVALMGHLTPIPQENQVVVGDVVLSVPDLKMVGIESGRDAYRVAQGPIPGWVARDAVVFLEPDSVRVEERGLMHQPKSLAVGGDRLAVAGERVVTLVDLAAGRVLPALPIGGAVLALAGDPSRQLFVLTWDAVVALHADGTRRRLPLPEDLEPLALALTPEGHPAVLGASSLVVVEPTTGVISRTDFRRKLPIGSQLSEPGPDGQLVVVDQDKAFKLDRRGKLVAVPPPRGVSPRATRAATWAAGRLWTLHELLLVVRTWPDLKEVARLDVGLAHQLLPLPGGDVVAVGADLVRLSPDGVERWRQHSGGLEVTYDPRRDVLWEVAHDGAITRRSAVEGSPLPAFPPGRPAMVGEAAFLADGSLAAIEASGTLWHFGRDVQRFADPSWRPGQLLSRPEGVLALDWSETRRLASSGALDPISWPTQGRLLSATADLALVPGDRARILSLRDGHLVAQLPPLPGLMWAEMSENGLRVAALTVPFALHEAERGASRWTRLDVPEPRRIAWQGGTLWVLTHHGLTRRHPGGAFENVYPIEGAKAFLVHPRGVVVAGGDVLHFLDPHLKVERLAWHPNAEDVLAASADGRLVATSDGTSVVVWDVATGTPRVRYTVWSDGFWEIRPADGPRRQGRIRNFSPKKSD